MSAYSPTLLAAGTLWSREVSAFLRTRSRVLGALATPVVFWALIGSGIGRSFLPPGAEERVAYLEYFFPGALAMVVLFTSIFATISVIEDRREGFLQSVLVAPVRRTDIVLGKVLGGATLAVGQSAAFLLVAPLVGFKLSLPGAALLLAMLALMSFGLTAMGLYFAWTLNSVQGYHAVMNLVQTPMWFLSGALFPPEGAATWLRAVMYANPLTYGVAGLRHALYWETGKPHAASIGLPAAVGVSVLFAAVAFAVAVRAVSGSREGDLR